ncbi:chalcone isomerase family protein [Polaromonas sp. YR568]|uniref:chalcone isomerase family protein n=1 Tax=Polaromonas sp. YR568 TaxID=1855301 RepID=UPI00398C007F
MKNFTLTTLVLSCALFAFGPAHAVDLVGAWQPTLQTTSGMLQLNGTGLRMQGANGLYTAGLYLEHKQGTSEAVLGDTGARQLKVVMLREASASEMGELLAGAMVANASDEELVQLAPVLFRLGEMFGEQKKLAAGDSFQIDWQPGLGTAISVNGRPQGERFSQPELFNAMLRMWLGKQPADGALKNALLGQAV